MQAEKLKNVKVKTNDVLFNITGASIARCAIVPVDVLPARVNQHVSIIRVESEKLNPVFLTHLLISQSVKTHLLNFASAGGAVMEAITKEQLEMFQIIIPPIALQNEFADKLLLSEKIKSETFYITIKSGDLFQSLLQKAFTGELTRKPF